MKTKFRTLVIFGFLAPLPAIGQDHSLQCDIGPVTKSFGTVQWLVYSCDDKKTIVAVSPPDSPASPFYFIISPTEDGYHLGGEGAGDRAVTDAAYEDLQKLSSEDISALISETIEAKGQ